MADEGRHIFSGDLGAVVSIDLEAPIKGAAHVRISLYAELYHQSAQAAEAAAGAASAAAFRFLGLLCTLGESFDVAVRPFSPMFESSEGRSFFPGDLSSKDLETVAAFARRITNPLLQARLFDIVWVLRHDPAACAAAATGYIVRAKAQDTAADWPIAIPAYQRAVQLAAALGRTKELFREASDALIAAARTRIAGAPDARNLRLMRLMLRHGIGDPAEFSGVSAEFSAASQRKGILESAQGYREIEADWHKLARELAKEKIARLAAGELMVEIAERRLGLAPGGAMSASSLLVDAIEALRRAGADRARVEQLRARLTELQQAARAEMGTFSHAHDITDQVKEAEAHVARRPFEEALLRFAFGVPTVDPAELKKEIIEKAQENPLSSLIDADIVDEKGRTVAREEGFWGKSGDALEAAIEAKMFSHAAKFVWRSRVSGFINPARLQILSDHHPSFEEILRIVRNNPFVPPDHEEIFLRGLHAGFHGDFIVAVHLLVPQVENSLRYILEEQGVDVSNLQSDKTQPLKILGALLSMEPTKRVLGPSLHFEVRGHLIEKTGFDFRNKVAHGFVDETDCYSAPALAVWWLVLHLCLYFAITGGCGNSDVKPAGQGSPAGHDDARPPPRPAAPGK